MYRNLLLILLVAAFAFACDSWKTTTQEQTTQEEEIVIEEPTVVALAEFKDMAETLVGKEVMLEGTVIHVCKHGGKKMFITADDPDIRIKITADDETTAFDPELEGSFVKVFGIVEAIESEVLGEGKHAEEEEEHEHEKGGDHEGIYNKPQYSVACIEYEVKDIEPEGE